MREIETITTSEATRLLGCSERTLRRRLRKAGIEPIVAGQGPSEQNRYDRAAILTLGDDHVGRATNMVQIDRTDMAVIDLKPVMAAIDAVKREGWDHREELGRRMAAIEESLGRIERALEQAKPRPWWAFWR